MRLGAVMVITFVLSTYCAFAEASYSVNEKYAFKGEKVCGINGQLEFGVTTFRLNPSVKDIKGIGMKFNNSRTYAKVPGKWYDKNYLETAVITKEERTIFVSNESSFKKEGTYTIILANRNISEKPLMQLNMFTGENLLEDGSGLQFEIYCPKIKYLCKPMDLKIVSCNNTEDGFTALFTGLGNSGAKPSQDLEFSLSFRKHLTSEETSSLPADTKITTISEDSYALYIPVESLRQQVSGLSIKVKECNSKLYSTDVYRSCQLYEKRNVSLANGSQKAGMSNMSRPKEANNASTGASQIAEPSVNAEPNTGQRPGWLRRIFDWFRSIF